MIKSKLDYISLTNPSEEVFLHKTYQTLHFSLRKGMIWLAKLGLEAHRFHKSLVILLPNRKIGFISLVNIIMKREVVKELIQHDMTVENAAAELRAIMKGGEKYGKMMSDYAELQAVVGGKGASDRFAARMVELLKSDIKR